MMNILIKQLKLYIVNQSEPIFCWSLGMQKHKSQEEIMITSLTDQNYG